MAQDLLTYGPKLTVSALYRREYAKSVAINKKRLATQRHRSR